MDNIELRWVIRSIPTFDGSTGMLRNEADKILQYRKLQDIGAFAGYYGAPPAKNLQWSEWTDVPTTSEG
jgi:hypothetical protein